MLTRLGINACVPQERLLLFLHQTAARTAACAAKVAERASLDPVLLTHVASLEPLEDTLCAEAGQAVPGEAHAVARADVLGILNTRLRLAEDQAGAAAAHEA